MINAIYSTDMIPFIPTIDEIKEFAIYDRWGNQVFFATNVQSGDPTIFWSGVYNGQPAKQGVYAYYLR